MVRSGLCAIVLLVAAFGPAGAVAAETTETTGTTEHGGIPLGLVGPERAALSGGAADQGSGQPLIATPTVCWTRSEPDAIVDLPGDIASTRGDWSCGSRVMRFAMVFFNGRSAAPVDFVGFALDTDRNLSNHCAGAEYFAFAEATFDSNARAALLKMGASCDADPVWETPLSTTGMLSDPRRIGVDIPWPLVGNPRTVHYSSASFDGASRVLDVAPDGDNWYTLAGFRETTIGNATNFVNGAPISINGSYSHLVPGDFNGDGADDIALVGNGPRSDALKLGGTTGFRTSTGFALNGSYDCVVGTDFDADGDDDLILIGNGPKLDAIKRGGPNGFVSGPPLDIPGVYDHCLAGDYNADGRGDIALIADNGGTSLLKRSDGTGTWSNRTFTVATDPDAATSADFNGDGHDDIALPTWGAGPDTLLMGTTGGFTTWPYEVGSRYDATRAGDYNADRYADILYYNADEGADVVRRGRRTTGPTAWAPETLVGFARIPIVGDFDGNGTADLVWHGIGAYNDLNWRGVR